ncbi:MAG: GNAT family N-acetyltransferase [Dysgonomonas sp.]|nr:GNAT family N-acetyltransferase [Dysgonomonas sp.]
MIRLANEQITPLVREMWETCFDDTDEFIDLYFSRKYKPENTLVYFQEGKAIASLQMLPYTITFYGETIPFYYLAGLCTLPEYRGRGYMTDLIHHSHQLMDERDIPLSILLPAENSLYAYYQRFGYEQVFDEGMEPVYSLKKILDTFPDINDAYRTFNALYKTKDFCVQKSFDDFFTIVEEQKMDGFPVKYNLPGMARIINETWLLNLYANKNHHIEKHIKIVDSSLGENAIFTITRGYAECMGAEGSDIEVDIRLLCRLLFGYKTNELPKPYSSLFPVHNPIMNYMLE